ncbi:beta-ketoacyl reductase, partial [Streptomyces sp. S6]
LTALGAHITACDITDEHQLTQLLDTIPNLTAVIHTAGVLDDTLITNLTPDRLNTVLHPKAHAAWNLHRLTRHYDLKAFILFSSAAGTLGSAGQANYAAANAHLDALATHRHAQGLPATSVAWGRWAGDGLAARESAVERLERDGVGAMAPEKALAAFDQVLAGSEPCVMVMDVDWGRFVPRWTAGRPSPLLSTLPEVRQVVVGAVEVEETAPGAALRARLVGLSRSEQHWQLLELARREVAAVLGHSAAKARETITADRSFRELGFDSLTAVELRKRLNSATGLELAASLAFDHPTPRALAEHLWTELDVPGGVTGVAAVLDELELLRDPITALTDTSTAEVAARLRELLRLCEVSRQPSDDSEKGRTDLETASDDQMFEFLGKEFGIS